MNTASKKFGLAVLAAPVLAALAIGMAGTSAATPAGPQPSDTGTTKLDTKFENQKTVPAKLRNKGLQGATQEKPKLGGTNSPPSGTSGLDETLRALRDQTWKNISVRGIANTPTSPECRSGCYNQGDSVAR